VELDDTNLEAIGCEVVVWIHLASDRVQWQALVNTALNIPVT
jgi:hypothetical protein